MKSAYQLLVIGAGPAGMAAAQTAAGHGLDVALVDEQAQPGGQIYRNVDCGSPAVSIIAGKDYAAGKPLVQDFRRARLDYFAETSVWYLDKTHQIGVVQQATLKRLAAERVILAGGAQERPMPFPGWQLPGVMTAGAGQILLKSAALVPREPPVLAGSGPLLLLLAWQFLRAGTGIRAIVDTTPRSSRRRAWRHLPRALAAGEYLFKGLQLVRAIRRAGIPWFRHARRLEAQGNERLQSLEFDAAGQRRRIDCELLLIHQGLIPGLHISEAAGCDLGWNPSQQCWQARTDVWGETSQAGIFVAGDAGAIGGARVADLSGRLAGLQVARQLGALDRTQRDRLAAPIRRSRRRHLAIRPFLDAYYRVAEENLAPSDETLVCRCEEVTAAQIRSVIALGATGPNQVKAFTRCGMGPCQGRNCGATLEQICAHESGLPLDEIGRLHARPPLKPVTLGQLAMSAGDKI